ncbi:hypothetical protein H8356DRAFT_1061594 [Neocallimastix lanati (nom. inval.)]|uniref:Uncharacterized protein n=1 Tax=Neocallimastix californiae TaxID=1754190 RepID=A0A1Y2EQ80_9FUNG|nr:hypothetical protein H8356DRAFT_1061594 [Neocallimastix sp. JGI-2020a]ORY73709.1 hypothetical protein LY90DRAFT_666473 [Neocallimastix californiae]|eukprot:ORY73709.1 hypothetical protein LY90DRAFT_666473 [Neocallimastix californiae]
MDTHRNIDARIKEHNIKYLNSHLIRTLRTLCISIVFVDITSLIYDEQNKNFYPFLIPHLLSLTLCFISTIKPKRILVLQFLILSILFIIYSICNFAVALTFLIVNGYNLLLFRLIVNGCSSFLEIYTLYEASVYYNRIKIIEEMSDEFQENEELEELEGSNAHLNVETETEDEVEVDNNLNQIEHNRKR